MEACGFHIFWKKEGENPLHDVSDPKCGSGSRPELSSTLNIIRVIYSRIPWDTPFAYFISPNRYGTNYHSDRFYG